MQQQQAVTVDDLKEENDAYRLLLIVMLDRLDKCGVSGRQFNDDLSSMQREGLRKKPVRNDPLAIRVMNRAFEILRKAVHPRKG